MDRNNPINSVYLIALAVCSLILVLNSFYTALIFAIVVVSVFLISVSIVSMVEKLADKHIRFLLFALISAGLITILKVLSSFIAIDEVLYVGEVMEYAILPCLMLAIVPIYFENRLSIKEFFGEALLTCVGLLLMLCLTGCIVEILGYGTIAGVAISSSFTGMEFFKTPYAIMMIVATLAILFNIVRRTYLKKTRRFNMLVEKYKVIIRDIRDSEVKQAKLKGGNNE